MSYSRRPEYKTMRERNMETWRKFRVAILVFSIAAVIYAYKNRIHIQEYFMSFGS